MLYKDLLPVFLCSGALNVILIACVLYLIYINNSTTSREFYRMIILALITLAYASRIALFVYTTIEYPNGEFNREADSCANDFYRNLLIYAAALLHPLAAVAYICRWTSYICMTSAQHEIAERKVEARMKLVKIGLLVLGILSVTLLVLKCFYPELTTALGIYLISLYFITPTALLIVIQIFLKKLQANLHSLYKRALAARFYSIGISIILVLRGLSILLDLICQTKLSEDGNEGWFKANDIIQICFYFLENFPSIVIIVILYKSYKASKSLTLTHEILLTKDKSGHGEYSDEVDSQDFFESVSVSKDVKESQSQSFQRYHQLSTADALKNNSGLHRDNSIVVNAKLKARLSASLY